MNLLPALTLGLSFGLVVGIVVYFIIDYFEADERNSRDSSELIFSRKLEHTTCRKQQLAIRSQETDLNENKLQEIDIMVVPSNSVKVVFDGKTKFIL